jgi:hypothetical protein
MTNAAAKLTAADMIAIAESNPFVVRAAVWKGSLVFVTLRNDAGYSYRHLRPALVIDTATGRVNRRDVVDNRHSRAMLDAVRDLEATARAGFGA